MAIEQAQTINQFDFENRFLDKQEWFDFLNRVIAAQRHPETLTPDDRNLLVRDMTIISDGTPQKDHNIQITRDDFIRDNADIFGCAEKAATAFDNMDIGYNNQGAGKGDGILMIMELNAIYAQYDISGDGLLSKKETKKMYRALT